jgi:Activator of Hsp90 ATPase homolog 1-like protein
MTDVTQQINEVQRKVGTRVLEAGEARTVTISRTYAAAIEDVWDACTNAERIPRWFLPVSGDLRPGGRYQLEGHAGGTIERCDPPASFLATWEYGGEVSWIEVRLTAEAVPAPGAPGRPARPGRLARPGWRSSTSLRSATNDGPSSAPVRWASAGT